MSDFIKKSMIKYINKLKHKFYYVYFQPNLFAGISVICSWGSLKNNCRGNKITFCANDNEVQCAVDKIDKTRLKRGYVKVI